ncbi:MAG TPA: cell division protein FtsA [Thermodesulfovibrionales bacterium]|nr:cell division protein FtsA [Thermodesulfovibrionales bacterium]
MKASAFTKDGDFAVGLDVGTTKICAISGTLEAGNVRIICVGTSPSFGLRKGIVVDAGLAASSIKTALKNAEDAMGHTIASVVVGIAGGHIKGFSGYGAIGVKGGVVREEDVDRLMDSASAVYVPVDREILHVMPSGFRLDGNNGIKDPVGMSCERLEAQVHIVTGSVTSVQNLIRCSEIAGVEVADIVLEPLASADAVLSEAEKEKGVALVDIGGGTTDIAVYRNGVLRHTAVLALGGNHITNDLAVGLGIQVEEAERLKKTFGSAMSGMTDEMRDIDVYDSCGQMTRVPVWHLLEVIQPRCEELMALVKKEAFNAAPAVSSVVLTGGTSLLNRIDVLAESVLGCPVRMGIPENVINGEYVKSPAYATGIGLLQHGISIKAAQAGAPTMKRLTSSSIFERMKSWVREYLK